MLCAGTILKIKLIIWLGVYLSNVSNCGWSGDKLDARNAEKLRKLLKFEWNEKNWINKKEYEMTEENTEEAKS